MMTPRISIGGWRERATALIEDPRRILPSMTLRRYASDAQGKIWRGAFIFPAEFRR